MSQQILSLDTICTRKRERKEDNEAAAALEDVFVRFTRLQSDNLEDDDDVRFFQITIFFFLSFFEFHGTVIM